MYVRFRQRNARLLVSLIQARRIDGKVEKGHVGFLGSVPVPPTVEDRIAFYQRLFERLSRLANRVGGEDRKLLSAIHARVPMPTLDEQRGLRLHDAEADEQWWSRMRDMNQDMVKYHDELAATVQSKIAAFKAEAANADAQATAARERAERIKRGED